MDFTAAIEFNRIEFAPISALAYYSRALARANGGDNSGAIADATQAIELNPDCAEAYYIRSFAENKNGEPNGAVTDYNRAIELDPKLARK